MATKGTGGYTTYNTDGSVKSFTPGETYKAQVASDIASGKDTPIGVGGKIDQNAVGAPTAGTQGVPIFPKAEQGPGPVAQTQFPNDVAEATQIPIQEIPIQGATNNATTGNLANAPVSTPISKYQQAHDALRGTQAPTNAGEARTAVTNALKKTSTEPDTTAIDSFISGVPQISDLMKNVSELLNPVNQTTSLMEDYKSLYKESGLDKINQEIIDADTIINGTEEDIRNEVQMAGGMATESQVQAMSLSRNKSLLKRYNQLVQMKTDATNQLNTLSQLNYQDKQMAQSRLDTQINTMFKLADFNQQATNNTREQYKWLTQTMGADGLYNSLSKDPRQLGFAESILGVPQGGLKTLADQAVRDRAIDASDKALDRTYKQAQIDNIYADIKAADAKANPTPYKLSGGGQLIPYNGTLTKEEQAKIANIETGESLVDQLENLYTQAIGNAPESTRSGVSGRLAGLGRVIGSQLGLNQGWSVYQNFIDSNLTPIAKSLKGEVGAITDTDKRDAKKTFPGQFSSATEAQAAFDNLRQQLRDQKSTFGDVIIDY